MHLRNESISCVINGMFGVNPGQKGIGFKSVFLVSDSPEIHSNGFHFKFDKNSSEMGYILPHWIEEVDEPCDSRSGVLSPKMQNLMPDPSRSLDRWTTRIVLPFKEGCQFNQADRFDDLHPNLLLFLNRLRCISLTFKEIPSDGPEVS